MKNKKGIRFLAFLLVIAMVLSCGAFAEPAGDGDTPPQDSTEAAPTPSEGERADNEPSPVPEAAAEEPEQTDTDAAVDDEQQLPEPQVGEGHITDVKIPEKQRAVMPPAGSYAEGQLMVKICRTASLQGEEDIFSGIAANVERQFDVSLDTDSTRLSGDGGDNVADWYRVELARGVDMESAWNALLEEENVITVEPNYTLTVQGSIDKVTDYDPYIHSQVWLEQINATGAWDALANEAPGDGVTVAVVDSGVDINHPDLTGNLIPGYDFVDGDATPDDEEGHGTHVAGIIAAAMNNQGVRGVAWGAKILPVRVMDRNGSGNGDTIIKGLLYAAGCAYEGGSEQASPRAQVINMSLGGFGYSQAMQDAVNKVRAKGCLVVAAAGNEWLPTGFDGGDYYGIYTHPANCTGVLTVMAMDYDCDSLAYFSNYDSDPGEGYEYEIMAPGTDIISTYMGGGYGKNSGTSMACPVVAGAAAVLMGKGCTADKAWELLVGTGTQKGAKTSQDGQKTYTYPLLNLQAAVNAAGSAYALSPMPANAYCCAGALQNVTMSSGSTVNLEKVSGSSRLFYKDGVLISPVYVGFENLGGKGTVTVTGTIGGVPVNVTSDPVELNADGYVSLVLNGTPTIDSNATVSAQLTVSAGGVNKSVSAKFTAFDLSLPEGLVYNSNGYYQLTADTVEIKELTAANAVKCLCLDANLIVGAGQSLTVNDVLVHMKSGVGIITDGKLNIYNSTISSEMLVNITGQDNGTIALMGDYIYDPNIDSNGVLAYCKVVGNGAEYRKKIACGGIALSGLYNMNGIDINCTEFQRNTINRCYASTLTADWVSNSSFVENFANLADSELKVYVPDYSNDTNGCHGFYNCNAVGPMSVYKNDKTTPAIIQNVYYQQVGEAVLSMCPASFVDSIACAASSSIVTDSNYAPAFVTGVDLVDYQYDDEFEAVRYTLKFSFSTPVDTGCNAYCRQNSEFQLGECQVTVAQDGLSCQVTGMSKQHLVATDDNTYTMTEYFELGGYYSAAHASNIKYSFTGVASQFLYNFPVTFTLYPQKPLSVEMKNDTEHPTVMWSVPADYSAGCTFKILRSTNGGAYSVLAALDAGVCEYKDTTAERGNIYRYEVVVYYQGDEAASGTASVVYSLSDAEMGVDFAANKFTEANTNTVDVSLNGGCAVNGSLKFNIAPGATIEAIDFSQQVKTSGLTYGATKNGDGSIIVNIGCNSQDSCAIYKGTLFTLTVKADTSAVLKVTEASNAGSALLWQKNDECDYTLAPSVGCVAQDKNGDGLQLWRNDGSAAVYYATYNDVGRMTGIYLADSENSAYDFGALKDTAAVLKVFYLGAQNKPVMEKSILK